MISEIDDQGRLHVDLATEAEPGGPPVGIQVEHHPLPLTEHAEDGALERIAREVELGEVAVSATTMPSPDAGSKLLMTPCTAGLSRP